LNEAKWINCAINLKVKSDGFICYLAALLFFSGQAHDLVKFVSAFSSHKVITLYPVFAQLP